MVNLRYILLLWEYFYVKEKCTYYFYLLNDYVQSVSQYKVNIAGSRTLYFKENTWCFFLLNDCIGVSVIPCSLKHISCFVLYSLFCLVVTSLGGCSDEGREFKYFLAQELKSGFLLISHNYMLSPHNNTTLHGCYVLAQRFSIPLYFLVTTPCCLYMYVALFILICHSCGDLSSKDETTTATIIC